MTDPSADPALLRRPLRAWFSSDASADACLALLADLIERAHAAGPACWALAVLDARTLSLAVGNLLMMRFSDNGSLVVAVDLDVLERLRPADRPTPILHERDHFLRVPEMALLRTDIPSFIVELPWMRGAIDAALVRAVGTVRTRTNVARYHAPDAVRLVGAALDRALPQPDHQAIEAPTGTDADSRPAEETVWTVEDLRAAWAAFQQLPNRYGAPAEAVVRRVRDADPVEFRGEELQRTLWKASTFASAGPGESIDVRAAFTDDEVLDRLDALRTRVWPDDREACAASVRAEYDAVLERLGALGLRAKPMAKLARAFAILVPERLAAVLQTDARTRLAVRVLGTDRAGGIIESQVKVRARLREVLGPERDLPEHVARIRFCWWLQDAAVTDAIEAPGENPPPEGGDPGPALDPVTRLALWPFGRQYRGIAAISGYAAAWRDLLRAAQAGQSANALVDEVRQGGSASSDSVRALQYALARMLALGLVSREDGVYRPTEAGMRALEGDNEPLIEALLVRNYGFAQVLRRIAEKTSLAKGELFRALRTEYPQWTSDFGPSSLLAWTHDLGLTEPGSDRTVRLTEYGAAWHARLPDVLPSPPVVPRGSDAEESFPLPLIFPSLDEIEKAMLASESARGFVIDRTSLAALHAGWVANPTKHFVILSGLSGTGKTAVLRHYARAVCKLLSLRAEDHVRLVTVSPDWHDPTGLLGYFNALGSDPGFQPEPALLLLDAAQKNPAQPYFLILDEMNLARVERYLAPLLSAMESGEPITVHSSAAEKNVPQQIPWPRNLYLAGTVNMDESTHPFSDKVLDRAFTLEFWDVDLARFFSLYPRRHPAAEAVLHQLHDALVPARRHFGYRTAGEVIDFVLAMEAAGETVESALDHAVFSKILPKLRGEDEPALRNALKTAKGVTTEARLPRSGGRLALMIQRLEGSGVTRFWS